MCERNTPEIIAEIEQALRKALEPYLYTAVIPGGIMHETDRELFKDAMYRAVESVLQKHDQQKSFPTLQTIKDATTKENFGDPERNWLISECDRLGSQLAQAIELASAVQKLSFELGTTIRNLRIGWDCDGSKNCEREWHEPINAIAKRLGEILDNMAWKEWHPQAGTDNGQTAELSVASEEKDNVETSG